MNRLPNLGGCRDERFPRFSARPLRDDHDVLLSKRATKHFGEFSGAGEEACTRSAPIGVVEHLYDEAVFPCALPYATSAEHGCSRERSLHGTREETLEPAALDLCREGAVLTARHTGTDVQPNAARLRERIVAMRSPRSKSTGDANPHAGSLPPEAVLDKEKLLRRAGRQEGKRAAWLYLSYDEQSDTLSAETSWLPVEIGRRLPGFREQPDGTFVRKFRGDEHLDEVGVTKAFVAALAAILREM